MTRLLTMTTIATLLTAAGALAAPKSPGGLRGPVDVEARRAAIGRPLPPPAVTPTPPPIRDLAGVSYYIDARRSVADPARKAQNQAVFAPLRAFVARVTALADGWMESRPANPAYATQAVAALATWARAGALLGAANQQGEYEREWTLAGLALADLRVRDAPGVSPATRATVGAWLAQLARTVQPHYGHVGRMSSANNHVDWAALAVAAAGAAAQDRPLYDWGLAQGRIGLAQVRTDGFLPLELARGPRALHYHLFALAPLVMLAELARANGDDLYGADGRALQRLANRVIAGLEDPDAFTAAARAPQELRRPLRGAALAWAEPYFARFHDPRLAPLLAAARPLRDDRLGGDLSAAFAAPAR